MELITFNGRAGRLEYVSIVLVAAFAHLLNALVFIDLESLRNGGPIDANPLFFIVFMAATLVTWTAAIRRCHDLGRSGFFLLWQFVPLFGVAAALFVIFGRGDDMKNRFGPPPWSVTNRAEKRAELERRARAGAIANQVKPDEAWVSADGTFDMDGLWDESSISR